MKKIYLFISILLHSLNIQAQCDSVFFRNAATFIYDMLLIDTNTMIGAGDNGYIIKSKDGGRSWKNIPTPSNKYLRSVFAASDSTLYAVGTWQTILKSEDQGESWFPLYDSVTSTFTVSSMFFSDLYFFNKNKGFIVGDMGVMLKTNDGGISWKDTIFSTTFSSRLNGITFANDTLGFICGGGNILYRTRNGGNTWERINMDFLGFNRDLRKLRFINALVGYGVGDNGIVFKTTDGGTTWTQLNSPFGTGAIFNDLFFYNEQTGFIAGTADPAGLVLKTTDGGGSWQIINNNFPSPSSFYTAAADSSRKKIVFAGGGSPGDVLGYNGRSIISSTDSGDTFITHSANGLIDYRDTYFINDSTGFITGSGGNLFKTKDYAESWTPLAKIPSSFGNEVKQLFFLNETYGFAATDRIYKTNNGAVSWTPVTIPGPNNIFIPFRMHFFDTLTGLAVDMYQVYRTTDGGNSWSTVLTPPAASFFSDFAFSQTGKGFVTGFDGFMARTQDKGLTWSTVNLNTTDYLTAAYFYNDTTGFAGSADSVIYKTTNGGTTWNRINIGISVPVRSFLFINDTTGYLLRRADGGFGGIYKTKNGGLTWAVQMGTNEQVSRLAGKKEVYLSGDRGLIIKTDKVRAPGIPGYIYGPELNCQNLPSLFRTGPIENVSYNWTLSGGGTQNPLQHRNTINWNQSGNFTLSLSVSNSCGTSPIRQKSVIVFPATEILQQPQSIRICTGDTARFSVVAAGHNLRYQWQKGGTPVTGATSSTYTIPNAGIADAANYYVTVTGDCNEVFSAGAQLSFKRADSCVTSVPGIPVFNSEVSLYPVPVLQTSQLKTTVQKSSRAEFHILDANGQIVQRIIKSLQRGENLIPLSFSGVPKGFYILSGYIDKQQITPLKFVKL